MTLHIFNPEHDLSLAQNDSHFTAPHAARQLREDLSFLPVLWADYGDCVLVGNERYAAEAAGRVFSRLARIGCKRRHGCEFVRGERIGRYAVGRIDPWGWNSNIACALRGYGVDGSLIPSVSALTDIRNLSHRQTAAGMLQALSIDGTVGTARCVHSPGEVDDFVAEYTNVVVKAPWSGSGRGLRFLLGGIDSYQAGWIKNVLNRQGGIMVEPYYKKVKDFGMEFEADRSGAVRYLGLSLFSTVNGAYTGNLLATEAAKEEIMARYVAPALLDNVRKTIAEYMGRLCKERYHGPFGVDMMVVEGHGRNGFLLHPCVEINLRRTMGHVALGLSPADDDIKRVMVIERTMNNFQINFKPL